MAQSPRLQDLRAQPAQLDLQAQRALRAQPEPLLPLRGLREPRVLRARPGLQALRAMRVYQLQDPRALRGQLAIQARRDPREPAEHLLVLHYSLMAQRQRDRKRMIC